MTNLESISQDGYWHAFESLVNGRISCRGFLPEPVPRTVLDSVFSAAQRAPSNCNTQPWQVAVVSGDACDNLRKKIGKAFLAGEVDMDFPYDGVYEGVYKERQHAAAKALYQAQGIERGDKENRNAAFLKNFDFFDAPHAAFVFLPDGFGLREAADLGMYAQTLMLAMNAAGLGCCPQTALSFFATLIRRELAVDNSNKLLFGISFGYPDPNHPANQCRTQRAPLSETVKFID